MSEEKDFEVIDEKQNNSQEEETGNVAENTTSERHTMEPIDIRMLLGVFASELNTLAWQRMGLVLDPMAGRVVKDMEQAQLAIDVFSFIGEKLGSNLTEEEKREYQSALGNLKINFVKQKE